MNDRMMELAEQQSFGTVQPTTGDRLELQETIQQAKSLAENTQLLNAIYKVAKVYANSSMVPRDYQKNPDNCFVACELAGRMNVSPTLVMQNLVVVQGRPAWSGQGCIALVNGCGKFSHDLDFVFSGEPGSDDWGCHCETERKADGRRLIGTEITIDLARKEGWYNKNGSKWQTMPQQMLMYRAASWFARAYCPEVLMGFSPSDEVEDITQEGSVTTVRL